MISAVVITRNEERHIAACLRSLAWADERLVLDSCSTDRTVAIAKAAGARVESRPFTTYAEQRNAALDLARGDWVFFLDADERASPALAAEVRAVAGQPITGAWVPRKNRILGRTMRGGGWWPDRQLRLIRRGQARYEASQGVHEVAVVDGPTIDLGSPILHYNYERIGQLFEKQDRYASQHARDLLAQGVQPKPYTYLTQPVRAFVRRFVTWHGYRDGLAGVGLALLLAWYEFVAYWRLRELRDAPPRRDRRTVAAEVDAAGTLDLAVVIVNWNVRDLLAGCLESLEGRTVGDRPRAIVVVDNGSTDGSVAMVRDRFPRVTVIEAADNPGFAASNNAGAARTEAGSILLLNPDTVVRPGALAALAGRLAADPSLGAVGPRLVEADGGTQSSRRRFPSRLSLAIEATPLQRFFGWLPAIRRYYCEDGGDPEWLVGACLLIRRAAWRSTAGLDARYFMYYEETDWFRRAAAIGWQTAYVPEAEVVHYSGKSSEQNVGARHLRFSTSKLRYATTHFDSGTARFLSVEMRLAFLAKIGVETAKWLLGHKRDLRRQRVVELVSVLRAWPA